jgi:beta-lactamase class A
MAVLALFAFARPSTAAGDAITEAAQAAEKALKARVGVAVIDTGNGRTWLHRPDERFPMASTFKALACGALLKQGEKRMRTEVTIAEADLLEYAPVAKTMVGKTVSASELCAITLRTSDNTAANKVLDVLGGPQAVTAFVRDLGDATTRLDRTEPTLNESKPGDPRDTTSPQAMTQTLRALLLGSALDDDGRKQLTTWMESNEVGGPLLRAGIPRDWRIADRTGAGSFGTRGVIAVMWPPEHAPVVAAVYMTGTKASMDERNAAIAKIGKAIAKTISP